MRGKIAAVLLAAGQSTRFGEADKLVHPLYGRPLGAHAGETVASLPLEWKLAVCAAEQGVLPSVLVSLGFEVLVNPTPERGQSSSLAIGLRRATEIGADAALICLADMPFISRTHLDGILQSWRSHPQRIVATRGGVYKGPPAVFPAVLFEHIARIEGDRGARSLLDHALLVDAPTNELRDIDTPSDIQAYEPLDHQND